MSPALIQAPAGRLDALTVFSDASEAANYKGTPVARALVLVVRSIWGDPRAWLQAACDELTRNPDAGRQLVLRCSPTPRQWPLSEAELWSSLFDLVGAALKRDPGQAVAWNCYRALVHGPDLLVNASYLVPRDSHLMGRPGGLPLSPSSFDGMRLRAQLLMVEPSEGQPGGEVLRLTWEDTGRLVVQSLPGSFSAVDSSAEPE